MRAFTTRSRPRRARLVGAITAGLIVAGGAAVAQAQWSTLGGDVGHSGYQTTEPGTTPVTFKWTQADGNVTLAPVITAGDENTQNVVYGTSDGNIHVRRLSTGAAVGAPIPIDDGDALNPDTIFTGRPGGTVGAVEVSNGNGPGQVYIVHNDPISGAGVGDIEIAQIDAATGALVQQVRVAGTQSSYTISAPPVITPNGVLYFNAAAETVPPNAGDPYSIRHIYRVPIANASSAGASIGAATRSPWAGGTDDADVNDFSSPSIIYDRNGTEYVVSGTFEGQLKAWPTLNNPNIENPEVTNFGSGTIDVLTPTVPHGANGAIPGREGSGIPAAPYFYVAYSFPGGLRGEGNTRVRRFTINNDGFAPDPGSPEVNVAIGYPGSGLALTATVGTNGDLSAGRLIVPTATGLSFLDAGNLGLVKFVAGASLNNTPAATGGIVFHSFDNGQRAAFTQALGDQLTGANFDAGGASGSSTGQPAISRGYVAFPSNAGITVYRTTPGAVGSGPGDTGTGALPIPPPPTGNVNPNQTTGIQTGRCANVQRGTNRRNVLRGSSFGDRLTGLGGNDTLLGFQGDDCLDGGAGNDRVDGDAGDDQLIGGAGRDRITGDSGNDRVTSGSGNDNVSGGSGNDTLRGGSGRDTVSGGNGNDKLYADASTAAGDTLSGGGGNDTIYAANRRRDRINCGSGRDTVRADRNDRVAGNCERVLRRR